MANESAYIVASLEDAKAKELGQIISNGNARKILNFLASKNATETEMSKELKIPLPTIDYNIKQLMKAGMITINGTFYGKKGNKTNVYAIAKKLILIAPKGVSLTRSRIRSILPAAFITAGLAGLIKLFFSNAFMARANNNIAYSSQLGATEGAKDMAATAAPSINMNAPQLAAASHYALFFLAGALLALGIYLVFEWRRK